MSHNLYAPPLASLDGAPDAPVAPALWNPSAAARWSLLFTPVFGAFLHMRNWQALGSETEARQSRNWIIFNVAFLLVVAVLPDSRAVDVVSRVGGLALLVAWYAGLGREQTRLVAQRYGGSYPRRGWTRPLLCALCIMIAWIAVLIGLAVALGQTDF